MIVFGLSGNTAGDPTGEKGLVLSGWLMAHPFALVLAGMVIVAVLLALIWLIRRLKTGKERALMAEAGKKSPVDGAAGLLKIGKLHEQGERAGQQDCFGVSDESLIPDRGLLAVVADGMGGLSDGDRVSAVAVEAVLDSFTLYQGKCTPEQQLTLLARQAVESVNGFLGASGQSKSGCTLLMGLVRDGMFTFLSVGDSRVCLYRRGELMQLNREHIYRNKLALSAVNGEISLQEAYADPKGNGLVSFVGMGALAYMDMPAGPMRLVAGDKLLLMSDGVYNALEEEELKQALEAEPEEAVERLRKAIEEKAYTNQDNYTAVVIGYGFEAEE
ncbi:MAG: SpoIIE family protein phosphatase [Lachnospiraceae bacterium]|nr:SpoIIE family protein phosphatase [Lachnospiraceae bacterium]